MGFFDTLFGEKKTKPQRIKGQEPVPQARENPARSYQAAMDSFKKDRFQEALDRFEKLAGIDPASAPVHYMLGVTYSQLGGELCKDNDSIIPWLRKSIAAFKTAEDLARAHGGLTTEQLKNASEAALHGERVIERHSPSIPEERRRRIFADLMETIDTEFLLHTNLVGEMSQASRMINFKMMQEAIDKNAAIAEAAALDKVTVRHTVSRGQLLAIKEEGREKKWPFKTVR